MALRAVTRRYFDIDWNAEDETLRGKVLLPVLGKPLREVLEAGELELAREGEEVTLRYFQSRFPIADRDTAEVAHALSAYDGRTPDGRERLADLIARQHYRLAWWRTANDEINWRRFFDINELAGLRMEHAPAFEAVHALIFRLYADGSIDGVRIDHIDGLADPARYCRDLRAQLEALTEQRPPDVSHERPYIVVEKILLHGETLSPEWNCDGTTGYDFMNDVNAVQHERAGESVLNSVWHSVSGRSGEFEPEERAARREILRRSFSAQLDACAATFHKLAQAQGRELTRAALRRVLTELLVHFPVYRAYGTAQERPARDIPFLDIATAGAASTIVPADRIALDALRDWLTGTTDEPSCSVTLARAVAQFQQLSAPVAAKAVEDTAFYRYGRLISRNDVGFDAATLGTDAAQFHDTVLRRQTGTPHAMLATATHDHKRGEDMRARLAVISEYAEDWAIALPGWIAQCRLLQGDTHPGDIAILLQTIIGAWPLDLAVEDAQGRAAFAQRLAQWQQKALREAKLATDWTVPDEAYESAARELMLALVASEKPSPLLREIAAFAERIAPAGAVNGLAQTLLKLTVPGVPDIYQGSEFWDFSLVDPDNRRPVDFSMRAKSLDDSASNSPANWRDGRIKQVLIARVLARRKEHSRLFADGSYEPLEVTGAQADRVVAFARRDKSGTAIVVVPRAASHLIRDGGIAFKADGWRDTAVSGPKLTLWDSVLDQRIVQRGERLLIGDLFGQWPIALLFAQQ